MSSTAEISGAIGSENHLKPEALVITDSEQRRKGWGEKWWQRWLSGILVTAIVFAIVDWLVRAGKDYTDQQGWSNSELAARFFISPGFAGVLALIAAAFSFWGLHQQIKHNRRDLDHKQRVDSAKMVHDQQKESNQTWWSTFQWVADKSLTAQVDGKTIPPTVAAAMLLDLSREELKGSTTSAEMVALWESRQRACNGLAVALADKVNPLSPLGMEVLDSLNKLRGQDQKTSVESPALTSMLDNLTLQRAMSQKIDLICTEIGAEVLVDPSEVAERFNSGTGNRIRSRDMGVDALILKGDKGVWVEIDSSSNQQRANFRLRNRLLGSFVQVREMAEYPVIVAYTSPISFDGVPRRRFDIPDYLHFVSDGTEGTPGLKDKLVELLS